MVIIFSKNMTRSSTIGCMPHPLSHNMFFALKGSLFKFLFAITAAGVVPCGGPKTCRLYFLLVL